MSKTEAKQIFAQNLRTILTEKGLEHETDYLLAVKFNGYFDYEVSISASNFWRWRNDVSLPRFGMFIKLADWLDCEPVDLLPKKYWDCLQNFQAA